VDQDGRDPTTLHGYFGDAESWRLLERIAADSAAGGIGSMPRQRGLAKRSSELLSQRPCGAENREEGMHNSRPDPKRCTMSS